jgi:Kdo2-lipid IVA lauroyltransferase/acyltransferase
MQAIVYYLSLPILYGVSVLPMRVLYVLSDALFVLIYHVIGYRRKVVRANLALAFPAQTPAERRQIERDFFRWLLDLMVETLKLLTISRSELMRRCPIPDVSAFHAIQAKGLSTVSVMGHYGNWEWAALSMRLHLPTYPLRPIYKRLENPRFDRLVLAIRTRFGGSLIEMQSVYKALLSEKETPSIIAFLADQTPHPEFAHWLTFLHQDTAVFPGTEKIAKKFDWPVVFTGVKRVRRGYYRVDFELLTDTPREFDEGALSQAFTTRLEQDIRRSPSTWLWSHRRWKYTRPASLAPLRNTAARGGPTEN